MVLVAVRAASARTVPITPARNAWLAGSVLPISPFNPARTIPLQISLGEVLDVGMDVGSAADFTYQLPFTLTGDIGQVTAESK